MHIVIKYNTEDFEDDEATTTIAGGSCRLDERRNDNGSEIVPFGRAMRDQFLFADGWRNINHGIYLCPLFSSTSCLMCY